MIEREVCDWGVRLTVRPFTAGENEAMILRSEISYYRHNRGCNVKITFPGVSLTPLRIVDAQTWHAAFGALIAETRTVMAEMKMAADKGGKPAMLKPPKPPKPPKSSRKR